MAEIHYFDTNIAERYGVNCAVLLQNIWHWVRKNEANGKHFHDGRYWTFNSTKAFRALFPYLTQKQIETALKKLRDDGIIVTGNYNELKYDRTLWYAVTKKGESILLQKEMETTPGGNGFPTQGEPIPDINSNNKPNINGFDRFWDAYPKKRAKEAARKAWAKLKPNDTLLQTIIADVESQKRTQDWKKDGGKYIPYPATYLNGKRWEDEGASSKYDDAHNPDEDLGDLMYGR